MKNTNQKLLELLFVGVGIFTIVGSGPKPEPNRPSEPEATAKKILAVHARNVDASLTCPNGGIEVKLGVDDNGNSVLDDNEVDSTQVVCNGIDGANGSNGSNSLLALTQLDSHVSCPVAAVQIDAGIDSNSNGLLDAEEVTATSIVCSSDSGEVPVAQLSGKGVVKGKVPVSAISNPVGKSGVSSLSRRAGSSINGFDVTSQTGNIWLVPSDAVAAIVADMEATEQASEEVGEGEVEPPVVEAIPIEVDESGNYETQVPAGTDYEIVVVNQDASAGVQVESVSVTPGEATEVNIDASDLKPTGTAKLQVQSLTHGQILTNARVLLIGGGIDMTSDANGEALLEG